MAKMIIRCIEMDTSGARIGEPANEAFFNGYNIAERQLEGVAIRLFHVEGGEIDAEICLSKARLKALFVDQDSVREEALDWVSAGRLDVLSSTADLADDDMSIYDDALPYDRQAFRASPDFTIRRKP